MSYSIGAPGASKVEARAAIAKKFQEEVLAKQPVHSKDEQAAFANVDAHLALIDDPREGEVVFIAMHGSIAVLEGSTTVPGRVITASSGCNVYLAKANAVQAS